MCILHHGWGKFSDLWCSNYWKMHLSVKYLLCPLTKLSPSFLLSPPRHREIIHSSLPRGTIFMKICSPACRKGWGGDYTQPITLAKKGISIRWKYSKTLYLIGSNLQLTPPEVRYSKIGVLWLINCCEIHIKNLFIYLMFVYSCIFRNLCMYTFYTYIYIYIFLYI